MYKAISPIFGTSIPINITNFKKYNFNTLSKNCLKCETDSPYAVLISMLTLFTSINALSPTLNTLPT